TGLSIAIVFALAVATGAIEGISWNLSWVCSSVWELEGCSEAHMAEFSAPYLFLWAVLACAVVPDYRVGVSNSMWMD
ncbi:MAG: hypothetical protein ACXVF9_21780, partial [Blastococcus sp.]